MSLKIELAQRCSCGQTGEPISGPPALFFSIIADYDLNKSICELDEVWGDGFAELLEEVQIEIEFAYHNGDEAILKAKRHTSSTTR